MYQTSGSDCAFAQTIPGGLILLFTVRELVNYVSNKVSPFRACCSLGQGCNGIYIDVGAAGWMRFAPSIATVPGATAKVITHGSAVEPVPLTVANTTAFESAVWTSAAFQLIAALPILTLIVRQMYPELMTFVI